MLIVLLLLPIIFFKGGCCFASSLGVVLIVVDVLWTIKGFVWLIAELILFITGISKYCHGGVYTYGLILFIINGLGLLGLLCGLCQVLTGNTLGIM